MDIYYEGAKVLLYEQDFYDLTFEYLKNLPFDIVKIEFKTKDSDFVDLKHYERLIDNAMKCLKLSVGSKKTTSSPAALATNTDF